MTPSWLRDLGGADPYHLLDIPRDASPATINHAYRRRIRELHPDRLSGDSVQARMVNLAREILLDPDRRAAFDRHSDQPASLPVSEWDHDDVVAGAEPAPDPPANLAWDAEEVVVGTEPPPHPLYQSYPYQPSYPEPPDHGQHHPHAPAFRPASPRPSGELPIAALVCAFMFAPVGLILGIAGLVQHRRVPGRGRVLSVMAIVIGGAGLVVLCICYGGLLLPAVSG
jgi:hypothetical protein